MPDRILLSFSTTPTRSGVALTCSLLQKTCISPKSASNPPSGLTILEHGPLIERVKFKIFLTLIFFALGPQIHQAWGEDHCVSECHDKVDSLVDNSPSEGPERPDDASSSHRHSHQCLHSYALIFEYSSLQNPQLKTQDLFYPFTPYDSEEHSFNFIEPPILSART